MKTKNMNERDVLNQRLERISEKYRESPGKEEKAIKIFSKLSKISNEDIKHYMLEGYKDAHLKQDKIYAEYAKNPSKAFSNVSNDISTKLARKLLYERVAGERTFADYCLDGGIDGREFVSFGMPENPYKVTGVIQRARGEYNLVPAEIQMNPPDPDGESSWLDCSFKLQSIYEDRPFTFVYVRYRESMGGLPPGETPNFEMENHLGDREYIGDKKNLMEKIKDTFKRR